MRTFEYDHNGNRVILLVYVDQYPVIGTAIIDGCEIAYSENESERDCIADLKEQVEACGWY